MLVEYCVLCTVENRQLCEVFFILILGDRKSYSGSLQTEGGRREVRGREY